MKAKLRHGQTYTDRGRDGGHGGRGIPTYRPDDEEGTRLREDVKYYEGEAHRLRNDRDEMYEWYEEAFASYTEEYEEVEEQEALNTVLRNQLSEASSAYRNIEGFQESECASLAQDQRSRSLEGQLDPSSHHCSQ